MKKYFLIIITLATLWSCQKDERYENLNRDPKNPTQVKADFLFAAATVKLSDQMTTPNVGLNVFRFLAQYLTTTTYLEEPNYNLTQRGIPQNHWSELYRNVLFNLQDAKLIVNDNPDISEGEKRARIGQIKVLEVYAWQVLVDTFGDIPYTQALNSDISLTEYDDSANIYADLISSLGNVQSDLQAGQGFSDADVIYGGDMAKWEKFANSLRLRLAMRIADVNPSLSQETAEAAITGGLFTSNADNAIIGYQTSPPHTNPLWSALVQSGRSDYVPANTIVDYMNSLNDPRRAVYFDDNLPEYIGGVYGDVNSFTSYTHIGQAFLDPTLPGILLDYAEIEFYQAEASQRSYSTSMSAEDHYIAGISASIEYWGGTVAEAQVYIAQPEVSYDASNWKEQIGTQFWISMYNNPFQGWSVWRKFDAPELNIAKDSGLPVPLRYTYPINEQNLNGLNYEAASISIGGDSQQTKLFWDVN